MQIYMRNFVNRIMYKIACVIFVFVFFTSSAFAQTDPLPSWNNNATKMVIINFVKEVTQKNSKNYIEPEKRIAVFDNDGTLWAEKPFYFQFEFALDRVKALAPQHPEWKTQQPFKAILENDQTVLNKLGQKDIVKIIAATHAGMTTDEFSEIVTQWIATAKHPRFNRHYNELIYHPMLELLNYLRANEFKTYIVSGGGVEFMRPWVEKTYGIPPEQVVGSSGTVKFGLNDQKQPILIKESQVEFIDDGVGKPVGINRFIGRRPIFAFGNSDGDQQMLEWVAASSGPHFVGLIHHTDTEREWAYDRHSNVGKLDKALDQAINKHWVIVDMKNDWKVIFPFSKKISQ